MNAAREEFEHTGLVVVRELLREEVVVSLRRCFDVLESRGVPTSRQVLYTHREPSSPRGELSELMHQWLNPHRIVGDGNTTAPTRDLRARLREFAGRSLIPFQDVLMSKRGGHREFPWHQDAPFWPVDVVWGAIVWCALDPTDASNGAVEFALGSHLDEQSPAVDLHTGAAQEGTRGDLPDPRRFEVVCPTLAPGDAVIFHPRTLHRSGENTSGRVRRVWASTWLSADSRWNRDRAPRHPLASRAEQGAPLGEIALFGGVACDD